MKNKNGFFLAEETIRLIVGALVLVSLVALLAFFYYSSQQDAKLNFAESSLKYLIQRLEAGDKEIILFGPNEGYLLVWPQKENELTHIKEFCENKGMSSCICIQINPESSDKKFVCAENNLKISINSLEDWYDSTTAVPGTTPDSTGSPARKVSINGFYLKDFPVRLRFNEDKSLTMIPKGGNS